jgi:hypothetical protein
VLLLRVLKMLIKKILAVIGGGALGFAFYYFIGCRTGTCPISSNPYISTAYGALVGAIWTIPSRKKSEGTK